MAEHISKPISSSSQQLYESWVKIYLRQLNGQAPTQENAASFIEALRDSHKQNTVAVARNGLCWKFGFDLPSIKIQLIEPKYIKLVEVYRLIDNAPDLLIKTIIVVLFSSACRISEILGLKKADIDWGQGVITVTRKGGHRQRVKVDSKGMDALELWMQKRKSTSKAIFMDYTYNDIYTRFKKLGKKLHIAITPHVLRHSRVFHLMEAGVPLERVSDLAGHQDPGVTKKIYGRLRAEDLGKYQEQAKW